MLKFLGSTIGIIFLIGLLVVIGIFSLIFWSPSSASRAPARLSSCRAH